jgi:hypothetical protein
MNTSQQEVFIGAAVRRIIPILHANNHPDINFSDENLYADGFLQGITEAMLMNNLENGRNCLRGFKSIKGIINNSITPKFVSLLNGVSKT